MNSYHRIWLLMLVLVIVTTSMCGLANEHDVTENENLIHDAHLETQAAAAASLKGVTEPELREDLSSIELHRSVRFEPPQLDFGILSVGAVRSHTVTLINNNRNRSVYLSSVSGKNSAFSSSFFEAKMVPPKGNTTFNVIFLPREEGAISTSLSIHTSFGKLRLVVRGVGHECPYRLKPLVGIRAPLNATLMPEIHMYNPHETTLQILEIYSSGGQFQLELPTGDSEAPKGLWEIPPLATKPVIRIRFQGYAAGNYSAFIRIKIAKPHNSTDSLVTGNSDGVRSSDKENGQQVLVIPVEFEILPQYGLYAVNPLLEFGYVAVAESSRAKVLKQKISLRHSKNQLEVNDLDFKSITYISGVYAEGCQAIVLNPNEVQDPVVRLNEKVEIILKDKDAHTYHNVELIIRADIFKGSLYYDVNRTLFLVPTQAKNKQSAGGNYDNGSRLLNMRNDFQIALTIYNITTQHNDTAKLSWQMKSFETGMVLRPGLSFDLLVASTLCKQQEQDLNDLINYKTAIYVYTNITNFEIPIVISSARLFVTTQTLSIWRSNTSVYTKELDLGSIPIRETSNDGFVIIQNRNSLPIMLNMIDFQKPQGVYYHVVFLGCIKAAHINETNNFTVDLEKADFKFSSLLNEGEIAVYMVDIQPYTTEHNSAFFKLSTQYENITIHIKFSTALGRLEVDQEKLHFANCFPGKLCSSELSIRSSFKQPIQIKYINFTDSGLRFEDKNPLGSKIAPQSVTTVGRIYFRPSALCGSRCYIQQQMDESSTFPSSVVANSLNIPNFDELELRRRTELYRHFKYYFQNMDFTMTTKEMKHFQLNLMIELEWPQLVSGRQILPTVEVNKTHIYEVKISNPSDNPILIDYTLADPTLAKQTRISLPLEVVVITPSCYLTDKAVFSLVNVPPTKPILIPGLSTITVLIKFQADYVGTICTLLHIRNNLTLYEGVWISAKTVQSQFRLGNRKPGSQTPLLFEIGEQHLASACLAREEIIKAVGTEQHHILPQVTSRRTFTARNSGELPIKIYGFWIGDQPCRGYGFQVTNCSGFELQANSSKKIEISFQSDFSVTRTTRPLKLKTNLTYDVSYILVAQLPSKGLDQCEHLLPRPPWEDKIRNASIVMLLITFVLVLIAVHIDYGNIIYNQSILYEARDKGTVHPTFNLRNIAMRSTQSNSESLQTTDTVQRNRTKVTASEKNENSSATTTLALRKRSSKSFKALNTEPKLVSSSTRSSMTLAEMVSWTFGTKTAKKSTANSNNNKISKAGDQSTTNLSSSTIASNETKLAKSKLSEKSLIDKMDGDMKKSQVIRKTKVVDKVQNKNSDKNETEEGKVRKDFTFDKESKKEKNSPKLQTKVISTSNSSPETLVSKDAREKKKSLEATSQTDNTDKSQSPPKENGNGRKIGKTPGRERRKQSAQNNSPVISDLTNSSCSSSTSSSCSSHHNAATAKRTTERKSKVKASNSLKFTNNTNATNLFSTTAFSATCSPNSMSTNIFKTGGSNSPVDILSPWDCGNHATFSDVLQKSQQQPQKPTTSTDLMQQGSLFDLTSSSPNGMMENSEITAALTPRRSKNPASDLGPIGSRKSPSSTPVWEPIQSAITMQLPRPLNATSTGTSSTASSTTCYYPINSNFGYNDLSNMSSSALQQQQDIHAQLLALQRQLLEQQHLQQQQQQFLDSSNALNNNWSNLSSPLWSPILSNGTTSNGNNTWSLTPSASSSPSSGLVRPPPGLEQNFPINNNLATSLNSNQNLNSSAVTSTASTFNTTTAAAQTTGDTDNIPMFNLFGGLSSIWNDNWKQSTDQQHSPQSPQ